MGVRSSSRLPDWPQEQFRKRGIRYGVSPRVRSDIYLALLPMVNAKTVELLDDPKLIRQLTALERRTARTGKDTIDHGPGGHDDLINAVGGALVAVAYGAGEMRVYAVGGAPPTPTAADVAARSCDVCHPLATDCPHRPDRHPDPPRLPTWVPTDGRAGFWRQFGRSS